VIPDDDLPQVHRYTALERLGTHPKPGEGSTLAGLEVPPFESLEALRCEIKSERRRGACGRAESIQKEIPLGEESPLRFLLAPVARQSPAKVVSRSPARSGHFRLSANVRLQWPEPQV